MNILIVGCGRILTKHTDSLKKLNKHFNIVSICDTNNKVAEIASSKLKVPFFNNISTAIKKTNPDLVSILTPSGLHADHALEVLKHKRHVIIEKPFCLKVSDAKKVISLSKSVKKKVFIVMQNKFNLPVVKMREDIKKNKFGKIFHAGISVKWNRNQNYYDQAMWRGTWKLDGGVICNQASHHIDLLRTIMGEPVSVFAKNFNHMAKIQAEDTSLVIIKFKSNKSAFIEATTAAQPKNIEGSLSIMGTKGSAKIGGIALNQIDYYNTIEKFDFQKYKTNPKNVYGFGHYEFYKHVFNSIKFNIDSEFSCEKSIATIELINAIYKSNETGKEVFFKIKKKLKSKLLGN